MLKGNIVALVTPFDKKGVLDQEKLKSLINWHIKKGSDGILVCGTTGESATLTHDEHKRIIEFAVAEVNKRVPVLAGCGSNSTHEALELTEHASKVGADYALVITPYYNKPTQEGLYQHYKKINDSIDIPLIIYNVPSRTSINILPATVARIYSDCKNVIGIKEASGLLGQVAQLMSLVDDKFLLFSGSDEVNLPILSLGGVGAISVIANVLPKESYDLIHSFFSGDTKKAKELQIYFCDIIKALFIETNPIPVKTALGLMGMIEPTLRLPLCSMAADNLELLKKTLKKYKLI